MSDFWTSVQLDGNYIYHRGVAKGKRFKHKIEYKPALYYPSNKVGAWRTIEGIPLEERRFANIWEARAFAKKYADVENFKVYGNQRYQYAFIGETYPGVTEFDTSLIKTAIIDIEVDSSDGFPDPAIADKVITAITLHVNDKFTALGCKEWQPSEGSDIEYFHCDGELDLLTKFIGLWEESSPDIVTGWNINLFDIPYLVNRITKLMGAASAYHLSPWNKITARTVAFGNREFIAYDIMGVAILDYLELYKQAAKWGSVKNQESYALDHIAEVEIEEHKLDYRAQGYPTLNDLYNRNFSLYMEYNIHDVNLVHKIDNKLHLIDLALTLAYMNKVNFDDVFSQGRMWDAILYNRLHLYNVAIPPSKDSIKRVQFEGAYVKEPAPGRYRWLASFDLTSLYPHLIMMYNMSPETLVQPDDYDDDVRSWLAENGSSINVENMLNQKVDLDWLKAKNLTMTPNGQFFHCGRPGFLAQCMEDMYAARAKYKKQELDYSKLVEASLVKVERTKYQHLSARYKAIQTAIKITLNSCYGSLGSPYFRYFDVRIAEAVTLSGQLSIRWVQKAINEYLNKVLKTTG
ncbi:MAG: 3'-5' exonuclease, partial [Candidatus Dormibacteria bacterium]